MNLPTTMAERVLALHHTFVSTILCSFLVKFFFPGQQIHTIHNNVFNAKPKRWSTSKYYPSVGRQSLKTIGKN